MLKNYKLPNQLVCGCDEAGRGPLAGPVVAAAVILPKRFRNKLLDDSKKLNEEKRNHLKLVVEEKAITFGIGVLNHLEIDKINILNASFKAMHVAIDKMNAKPDLIIIDGNRFISYGDIKYECIIKGDGIYNSIAAASILAKTYRDQIMCDLHEEYPMYNWKQNKGYPTKEHREAIHIHGPSPYHRRSFRWQKPTQLKMF